VLTVLTVTTGQRSETPGTLARGWGLRAQERDPKGAEDAQKAQREGATLGKCRTERAVPWGRREVTNKRWRPRPGRGTCSHDSDLGSNERRRG
jgi:hypothetical protein